MAVGCMAMIDASKGGVAYTSDPNDASDLRVRISAALGLPKTVVDGRFDADLFIVDRISETVVERRIADVREQVTAEQRSRRFFEEQSRFPAVGHVPRIEVPHAPHRWKLALEPNPKEEAKEC